MSPSDFDALVKPRDKRELPTWTLPTIGRLINAGPDLVRTIAKAPGSPIHCVGGKWYCYESELIEWMKNPPKPM